MKNSVLCMFVESVVETALNEALDCVTLKSVARSL